MLHDLDANSTCANAILADLDDERRECNCQVECNEDDYMPTISSTTFPEYKFKVDFDINNWICSIHLNFLYR